MNTIRILIVDDLPEVRQGLASVLELAAKKNRLDILVAGFARDGNEALEKARLLHPQVILMDLEMPGMDGFEAARRIKAEQRAVRVIALTIHYHEEVRRKAFEAGMDAFLVKGTSIENILRTISK